MPPTKRKPTLRRQVLDLKGEDSSSRPTWQTKYQHIQSDDAIRQNGEFHAESSESTQSCNTVKTNPLSVLVGNYNSDSDGEDASDTPKSNLDAKVEDFLKEIQSLSTESAETNETVHEKSQSQPEKSYPSSLSKWQQCYDHNSGYPYYWNTETNEVTWEIPPEYKAALVSAAARQHQTERCQQPQPQEPSLQKEKKKVKKKVVCKYPWENGSDSEDEKIEMITSFGPQSGEEESEEEKDPSKIKTQKDRGTAKGFIVGPQLPVETLLPHLKKRPSESDDTEAESLNDSSYETSCLLTYRVQDTGPPGDDGFSANSENNTFSEAKSKVDIVPSICSEVPDNSLKKDSEINDAIMTENLPNADKSHPALLDNTEKVVDDPSVRDKIENPDLGRITPLKTQDNTVQDSCFDFADNVIAEIEKEMPPDYNTNLETKTEHKTRELPPSDTSLESSVKVVNNVKASGISGIALLANYEDDSESEDGSVNEKRKSRDKKSDEVKEEKVVRPLFPCMDADAELHVKESYPLERKTIESEPPKIYDSEMNLTDSSIMHKAFKRKKRIEFATTGYSTGPPPADPKPISPDNSRILTTTQYNMDPTSNEHRGFGFAPASSTDSSKSKLQSGWIQFVKTETINLNQDNGQKQKAESRPEAKQEGSEEETIATEEIEDAASLLKEKVTFLTEGKEEISPIQHIAIQLETLLIAWQQGALSNVYFFRWVKDKCSDLMRHEKSAAPTGWTCLWDRKSKRYFYRNVATKVIQWDYPTLENATPAATAPCSKPTKEGDPEGGGEEMELCFTPPHPSLAEEDKVNEDRMSTSPVPVVPDSNDGCTFMSPVTSNVPAFSDGERIRNANSTKRKEFSAASEDDVDLKNTSATSSSAYAETEKQKDAPPLPPMPPPPPPDEPPPPPPSSPPPLPLDPNQPLPPGVDEPEYGLFRRLSPKQSLMKSQTDTSSYGNDVMMTYGYAMQVQSNAASVATISMQPVDYHSYAHDHLSTNHYVVQTAPSSHVIHCPAKKSKLSLSSELDSFYSDIAMLENDSATDKPAADAFPSQESNCSVSVPVPAPTPTPSPQTVHRPVPSGGTVASVATIKHTENSSSNGVTIKRKKKAKLTPGLSMKKKGVSSLVAKWQQVQQEVRRDLSSDDDEDDDDTSGTHK